MWDYVLGSSISLIVLIALILIIYFIVSKSNVKKQKKHFKELHENLAVGKEVIFSNGLYGKIKSLSNDYADIEIKSGAVIKVSRYAISDIIK